MGRSTTANVRPIPILMYHQIAAMPASGPRLPELYVKPEAFARQMRLLRRHGFTGLSMSALLPYLRGERSGKVIGLTFDDGYRNVLQHALPVLRENGFTATCYLVSDALGRSNTWDQPLGVPAAPLMDADDVRAWVAAGQEIGSHTSSHRRLPALATPEAQAEVARSGAQLRALLDMPVDHFCYPYGAHTDDHVDMVRDAPYATATTVRRGRCRAGIHLLRLPRVTVSHNLPLPLFWMKVATGFEDRIHLRQLLRKAGG